MCEEYSISIVVPVYNSETYLGKTIDSILKQTYKRFELILINDGSADSSLEICQWYEKVDIRVRVISQENSGPSYARNVGIKNAKGDFLLFIDSDDWVSPNLLEILVNKYRKYNADVIVFGFDCEGLQTNVIKAAEETIMIDSNKVIKEIIKDDCIYGGGYTFNKFWKVKNIHKNKRLFNEDLFAYEDKVFAIENYKSLSSVLLIPEVLYHYNTHINSLSKPKNINWDLYENVIEAHARIIKILSGDYELMSIAFQIYYERIVSLLSNAVKLNNKIIIKKYYPIIKGKFFVTLKNSNFSKKTKFKYTIIYLIVSMYCFDIRKNKIKQC